jgi:1-acyl-sn-glycerol-3-phosphate acyltransferase
MAGESSGDLRSREQNNPGQDNSKHPPLGWGPFGAESPKIQTGPKSDAASGPTVQHSPTVTQRLVSWLLTVPFLFAFGGTLVLFDPLQRIARLFGQHPQEIVVGAMQTCLVFAIRISGMRLLVERSPRVKPNSAYLIVANHQSMFDIPILGATLFTNYPKYVSKRELAHWLPGISYNLRRGGNAIIERSDRKQAIRAIREMGATAQARRVSAVIYPEGTRSRTGRLRPFKKPGTLALLESADRLPVVPVTIDGSWKLLIRNLLPLPYGIEVRLRIGAPIERTEGQDHEALILEVREQIEKTLERWRSA